MYLLYADESNLNPTGTEFFVYGGLAIQDTRAARLSHGIEDLRNRSRIPINTPLKFNPAPTGMGHTEFCDLKESFIAEATENGCVLFANLILHSISGDPHVARRLAINTIAFHFDCFLNRSSDHGLVLIDRFADTQIDAQLRERFAVGVTGLPYSSEYRLKNVLGFHYSAIGQAHFPSVVDIVIGSLRYAVNGFSNQNNLGTARKLLHLISPLFLRRDSAGPVDPISLQFNPVVVKSSKYRARYKELKDFFAGSGIIMGQEIVSDRNL